MGDERSGPVDEPPAPSSGDRGEWTPVDGVDEPAEIADVVDVALIAEITNPIRGRIMRRLKKPRSVAELAELLEVPVTRLYHHVNRLEQCGLIRVVATRRSGAATERRYQVGARTHRIGAEMFDTTDPHELSTVLGSLFDVAKLGLQREVEAGHYRHVEQPEEHSTLSLVELHLTAARRVELIDRLRAVFDEFDDDRDENRPDTTRFTLFIAAYPEST